VGLKSFSFSIAYAALKRRSSTVAQPAFEYGGAVAMAAKADSSLRSE